MKRIHRQAAGMAAIVLLTGGTGAVRYYQNYHREQLEEAVEAEEKSP